MVTLHFNTLSVQFRDTSIGRPASWLWNFGDGQTSTDRNPAHTYEATTEPAEYVVTLIVTDINGVVSTTSKQVVVPAGPVIPIGCVYALPSDMAPADEALLVDLSTIAEIPANGGNSTAMTEDGKELVYPTGAPSFDPPRYLTRVGSTFTAQVFATPASISGGGGQDMKWYGISRDRTIAGSYMTVDGIRGCLYVGSPDTVPLTNVDTGYELALVWAVSPDGSHVIGVDPGGNLGVLADSVFTVLTEGVGIGADRFVFGCDFCNLVIVSSSGRWVRETLDAPWVQETYDFSGYDSGEISGLSADGSAAVGLVNVSGETYGAVFKSGSLIPTHTIDEIDGIHDSFIRATCCNHDASIVGGTWSGGAFLWTEADGARDVAGMLGSLSLDQPNFITFDAMSATGLHLFLSAQAGYSSTQYYAVIPQPWPALP